MMTNRTLPTVVGWFLTSLLALSASVTVNDVGGVLGATRSPVTAIVNLSPRQQRAAREGRLQMREVVDSGRGTAKIVPAQLLEMAAGDDDPARLCWLMPPGGSGERRFALQSARGRAEGGMLAQFDSGSGQYAISEAGKPVLRYVYATIEPGALLEQVAVDNRKYARARSDYIHPLFGFDGEPLTLDWPVDHPHHRGIYWAWPEVDWRGQRGDLHALQSVFARPTGSCRVISGPVFAQIEAENVWKWEDRDSLVRERAIIRAYRATGAERLIDLELQFTALRDPVWLARRGTDKYGGLNLRLARVLDQAITFHTDPANVTPRMAWAELHGRFDGVGRPTGLAVLQHDANPDYPGDWVEFPEINWFQPTFPARGERHELRPGKPLVLRFRLWLHGGGTADSLRCAAQWRAYHSAAAPQFFNSPGS